MGWAPKSVAPTWIIMDKGPMRSILISIVGREIPCLPRREVCGSCSGSKSHGFSCVSSRSGRTTMKFNEAHARLGIGSRDTCIQNDGVKPKLVLREFPYKCCERTDH